MTFYVENLIFVAKNRTRFVLCHSAELLPCFSPMYVARWQSAVLVHTHTGVVLLVISGIIG